jgi:Family of unknown function (DUF5681)
MTDENHDEVGYGKPPKETQFKKGESGNPKGRPKSAKNLKTDLVEELSERIVAREGERTVKISKQRAVIKTLLARTVKGDARAGATLLNLIFRVLDPAGDVAETAAPLSAEEREVLADVEARFLTASVTNRDPQIKDPDGEQS